MDNIKLLQVPFDFGQDSFGVRQAYSYLINRGLIQRLSQFAPTVEVGNLYFPAKSLRGISGNMKAKGECSRFNHMISDEISSLHLRSSFLLNIGGDHGLGLGTVHGLLSHDPETIVVWADAHGDINTPYTSKSANFHGMPLSFLLGLARDREFNWIRKLLPSRNLIYFGPRELDKAEKNIIDELGIQYFSSEMINEEGADVLLTQALSNIDPLGIKPIHLSFDVDVFDSYDMRSTGIRVKSGPRLDEVFIMAETLAQTLRLRSMDVVEFNPLIGTKQEVEVSSDIIIELIEVIMDKIFPDIQTTRFNDEKLNQSFY
ncbi:MAG: arginase [Bacteriovoracaceae bacterium]